MEPAVLAALHARCFVSPPPWSAAAFAGLLADAQVALLAEPGGRGFALARVVADEAELLTLAVLPEARRQGVGRALLARFEQLAAARGAARGFLEVAEDNAAACALYAAAGWSPVGRRPGYYRVPGRAPVAALVLERRFAAAAGSGAATLPGA